MASSGGVQQLLACQISSWYPAFARVTFKTVTLPLPPAVADWLVSDGLHLAPDSQAFAKRGPLEEYPDEEDYQEWSEDSSEAGGSGSEAAAQPPPPELEQLKAQVQAAIDELGGRVVPKLSWSCPKDAVWMSPSSSLACTNADEVLLLLRASDRVAHDICHAVVEAAAATSCSGSDPAAGGGSAAAAGGESASTAAGGDSAPAATEPVRHCLALRRWYDLQPGREFRCFVRQEALVGACQRDLTQCFEFLKQAEERRELAEAIAAFHAKHIQGRFPLPDYTYDVYVATSGAVRLLDFNPVGGTTAPLLFSWEELGLGGAAAEAPAAGVPSEAGAGAGGEAAAGGACRAGSGAAEQPAAAAACCGGTCTAQPGVAAEAAAGAEQPAYLEQLRRVQALSLAEQQQQGSSSAAPAAPGSGQQAAGSTSSGATEQHQAATQQQQPQFELRVIEEPVAMRPHTLAYGVPFDFVDSSEGSALDRLMAQAQQTGAKELWAALAAQGGAGSNGGQ